MNEEKFTPDSPEVTVMETIDNLDIIKSQESALIDTQIATANKFPRNITRCMENAMAIAIMDQETAIACGYRVPRAGKDITGASVHLARILVQNWKNVRAGMRIIGEDHKQVVAEAFAWDLENNVAIRVEVRRNIMDRTGKRFKDDMVTVTGMAAASIAYRNAVFSIIPRSVTDKIYRATRKLIAGDLSTKEKLAVSRTKMISHFKDTYSVSEKQILKLLNVNSIDHIKEDHIIKMLEIEQSLKDSDTKVEDVFFDEGDRRNIADIGKKQTEGTPDPGKNEGNKQTEEPPLPAKNDNKEPKQEGGLFEKNEKKEVHKKN